MKLFRAIPNTKYTIWATTWQNKQCGCAPSEDSDQPRHPPSLISPLCAWWVAKDPSFLHGVSEDSDQTGRMPRLIWVFGGRTLTLLVLSCRGLFWPNPTRTPPMVSAYRYDPKFSDWQVLANDQTESAIRSGSTLFYIPSTHFGRIKLSSHEQCFFGNNYLPTKL